MLPIHRLIAMASLVLVGLQPAPADESLYVDELVVVLIDESDVTATQSGVVAEVVAREGTRVKKGQVLARLDDRKAKLEQSLAGVELEIAVETAENGMSVELAEKKLAEQRQLLKHHAISLEVAEQKADNEVRVLASQKAEAVAKNELERAMRARRKYADSVSQSEIDGLKLSYDRTTLETAQAQFERGIDALHAKAEVEMAAGHTLGVERSKIELAQAHSDKRVQMLQVELQRNKSQLAELTAAQHKIVSPFEGVVVERFRNEGDWVNAGDQVIRVVRLNRLRAEGFVSFDRLQSLRDHRHVEVRIQIGEETFVERDGEIVFISPEIDPVNREVRFWVEFENPEGDVLPGMRLSLRSKS